jgi:hypothetical protein
MKIDISNNVDLLTLEYFSNNTFYSKINKPSNITTKSERKFYRRRIINETKKMLKNDFENDKLKDIFNTYVFSLITHFKAIDTHDLIQKCYDNSNNIINKESISNDGDDEKEFSNQNQNIDYLFGKEQKKSITLDNFIIKTNNKQKKENEVPEKKEINLNEPDLKNKGIKNKKKKTNLNV